MTPASIATVLVAGLFAAGCELPRESAVIGGDRARDAVARVTGVPLEPVPDPDKPVLSNVLAVYSGAAEAGEVTVVVFDSPQALVQLTGGSSAQVPGTVVVRVHNVVTLLTGDAPVAQAGALRSALRAPAT